MTGDARAFAALSDGELMDRLVTEGDCLPREAVDEMISRGPRMVDPLTWLVMDPAAWQAGAPARWGPVHATFLLGAIGGEAALFGLLAAADHAEALGCQWVLDGLPPIFARLGASVRPYVSERVRDPKRGARSRALMAECLAATTSREPEGADAVFAELGAVFVEETDDRVKVAVGEILLDFKRVEHRRALLAYARHRGRQSSDDPTPAAFTADRIERALVEDTPPSLARYTADWLSFYALEAIAERTGSRTETHPGSTADVEVGEEEWQSDSSSPVAGDRPRTGRNAACPCGSGKKYKNCCLDLESALGPLNEF